MNWNFLRLLIRRYSNKANRTNVITDIDKQKVYSIFFDMTKRQRGGHPDRLKDAPLFCIQKGKQGNLPAEKKIDRIG